MTIFVSMSKFPWWRLMNQSCKLWNMKSR